MFYLQQCNLIHSFYLPLLFLPTSWSTIIATSEFLHHPYNTTFVSKLLWVLTATSKYRPFIFVKGRKSRNVKLLRVDSYRAKRWNSKSVAYELCPQMTLVTKKNSYTMRPLRKCNSSSDLHNWKLLESRRMRDLQRQKFSARKEEEGVMCKTV